jgi:hypothetical protein
LATWRLRRTGTYFRGLFIAPCRRRLPTVPRDRRFVISCAACSSLAGLLFINTTWPQQNLRDLLRWVGLYAWRLCCWMALRAFGVPLRTFTVCRVVCFFTLPLPFLVPTVGCTGMVAFIFLLVAWISLFSQNISFFSHMSSSLPVTHYFLFVPQLLRS